MSNTAQRIVNQKRLLFPTGRAWKMPEDSYLYRLMAGLSVGESTAYENAIKIMDMILPDNPNFSSEDATMWETKLGLITNLATPLADRMLAIKRKMQYPSTQPAKAHYLYIQTQLQAAGFDVYVHENLFPLYPDGYESVSPMDIYTPSSNYTQAVQYGQIQYGQRRYGIFFTNMVVNSIYQEIDNSFNIGNTFDATFFIGGETLGTYANVLASREIEFRQLILKLKPVPNVAFLFINYT